AERSVCAQQECRIGLRAESGQAGQPRPDRSDRRAVQAALLARRRMRRLQPIEHPRLRTYVNAVASRRRHGLRDPTRYKPGVYSPSGLRALAHRNLTTYANKSAIIEL